MPFDILLPRGCRLVVTALSLSLSLSHCVQACEAALRRLSSEGGDVAARRALAEQVKALREQQRR